jgi:vanillate O-demethylase monooxygenase subunit
MFIKNCWYVAAWSSEVEAGKPFARTLLDIPVVLWRDSSGKVIAMNDRCSHRGAPLSTGRLEGDTLRCMYHGLLFNAGGRCVEIPAQERIPPGLDVGTFPVVEQHRWIWIWMGDPAKADPSKVPDNHYLDDPEWRSLEGYVHYDTSYLMIADNLLDLAHVSYVHETTLGGTDAIAKVNPKIRLSDDGVHVERWVFNTEPAPFVQKVRPFDGPVDRWMNYDFLLPGIFLMDSGNATAGSGAQDGQREGAAAFRSTQALTPESEHATHYFFSQPHNFLTERPEITRVIHEAVIKAFMEDHVMIHDQARNLRRPSNAGFKMGSIRADEALGKFRWLVQKRLDEEAKAEAAQA